MAASGLPFDDIRNLLLLMPPASQVCVDEVRARESQLAKPEGSLGRLEEIVAFLAAWQGRSQPLVQRPLVALFLANHGLAERNISASPISMTRAMLDNFAAGGAAVNQICATYDVGLKVFELALDVPTKDIVTEPAMDEAEAAATIAFGMEAIAGGTDLLALGETGVGNTTIAAAIYHALYGGSAADWVLHSSRQDQSLRARQIAAVEAAVALHRDHVIDPLELLRRLGGREILAIAGAILAARMEHIPVVLDGYVSCAAAAVLHRLDPATIDHCMAGHVAGDAAHANVLMRIGKKPLLDLGIDLGQGAGAALALGLIKAALACHRDMATFEQASVPRALP